MDMIECKDILINDIQNEDSEADILNRIIQEYEDDYLEGPIIGLMNPNFPVPVIGPPDRKIFSGDVDFVVEINSTDVNKKKYMYSHLLNRIYVDIKSNFSVQFNWDHSKCSPLMYVRAMVVFADDSQAEKRVERCLQHLHENVTDSVVQSIAHHVLQSSRALPSSGVHYSGAAGGDQWCSVLVALAKRGPEPAAHVYRFACKNSCPNGINRRAIMLLFTLEDQFGYVYGRQSVGVRVCSCLRRDMFKDEEAEQRAGGKRREKPAPAAPTTPKKIKLEVVHQEDEIFTLPNLQVIGRRSVATGLEVMLQMMEQTAQYQQKDSQALQNYNKCMADLKRYIDSLKNDLTLPST